MSASKIELNAKQRFDRMKPKEREAFLFGLEVAAQLADACGGDRAEKPGQPASHSKHARLDWIIYGQRLRAAMIARVVRRISEMFAAPPPPEESQ